MFISPSRALWLSLATLGLAACSSEPTETPTEAASPTATPTETAAPTPTPLPYPYARTLYLRGTMNNWTGDEALLEPYKFEPIDGSTLYVEAEFPFGNQSFKVADSGWSGGTNFGNPAGTNDIIALGVPKVMGDNGFDLKLDVEEPGVFSFTVDHSDLEKPSVTVEFLYAVEGTCAPDITQARAQWMEEGTLVWRTPDAASYALYAAPEGGITIADGAVSGAVTTVAITGTTPIDAAHPYYDAYPYLRGQSAFALDLGGEVDVPELLKGQLVLASILEDGSVCDATEVQTYGVIDDLLTYEGDDLGVTFAAGAPTFKLWAPTAQGVALKVYPDATGTTPTASVTLTQGEGGVWSHSGDAAWKNQYYVYDVDVYVRSQGAVVTNTITDPYSVSLSMNSTRSQAVDLSDPAWMPEGWSGVTKPPLDAFEDIVLYELHVRDFSANDPTCPESLKGTFAAFAEESSEGAAHLSALADAGVTHLHLLPAFDIASVNEDPAQRTEPVIPDAGPNSEAQQEAVEAVDDQDAFNWGYDPFHYMAPEGSYATSANGAQRILEFRQMVKALSERGLRVVMDQVYNHTNSAGQDDKSVLDKIVPGYYYRLDAAGNIQGSSCCPDTATEHAMMGKLMVDSVRMWATHYKVDGFRFDLMGHHTQANMVAVREALDALTVEVEGVDGGDVYLYGEGWKFGSLDAILPAKAMSQANSYGYGIGSFNDRIRDSIRGGSPLSQDLFEQGFATGMFYDDNYLGMGSATEDGYLTGQRTTLLNLADNIRIGLAGNLRDFTFMGAGGTEVTGAQVTYRGSTGAGYTADPQEIINYVSVHDNQTLWDNIQAKAPFMTEGRTPTTATLATRVRMQNLSMDLVALGQGIPFFHAGTELLRSKSGDKDSYNSSDWFNRIDWTGQDNYWGMGLPVAEKNAFDWPFWSPRLADASITPGPSEIAFAGDHFREILAIRQSSPLFRLRTAEDIEARVTFLNAEAGAAQIPGLIVMHLSDDTGLFGGGLDPDFEAIAVLVNATLEPITFTHAGLIGATTLHPAQAASGDAALAGALCANSAGAITVPPQTTLVCVDPEELIDL